jgi:hypothetical protein
MSDNDHANRQQEINMFAAMAAGDYSSGVFDSDAIGKFNSEAGRGSPESVKEGDTEQSMFAKAAAATTDNSGTFKF